MKKIMKFLAILLLIILLLAAAVCVWLYTADKKMDFQSDDVFCYANAEPMTDGERYSFSADADTLTMAIDKSDIYWYINKIYGPDFFDDIVSELEEEGVRVEGLALMLEEGQVSLSAKLGYSFLALNVRMPCRLSCDDSSFELCLDGVTAFGTDLTDLIDIDLSEMRMSIPYDHLMLERIDRMKICDGSIKLTGPMAVHYMGMAREGFTKEELEKMLDDSRCSYAANILYKYAENPTEGKYYWMSILENDPSLFTTVFEQLFSMISPQTFGGFHITELNGGMIFRLIPTYAPLNYQENYKLLASDYKTA